MSALSVCRCCGRTINGHFVYCPWCGTNALAAAALLEIPSIAEACTISEEKIAREMDLQNVFAECAELAESTKKAYPQNAARDLEDDFAEDADSLDGESRERRICEIENTLNMLEADLSRFISQDD